MDKITFYWINMNKSIDRRKYMEIQFENKKIRNKRVTGITPEILASVLEDDPPYFCGYSECLENNMKNCKIEYSCLCSHIEAIKAGYESGEEYFIVCEDDININFKLDINKLIQNRPINCEIIQMMIISNNHSNFFYNEFYKKGYLFASANYLVPSAAYYFITRKGAKTILDMYLNPITNKYTFKDTKIMKIADYLIYKSVNSCISTFPLCINSLQFESNIHVEHFNDHKNAYEKIFQIQKDYKSHPFIIEKYD